MSERASSQRTGLKLAFRALMAFDTVALFLAASLHVAGARIPLGSAVFVEPQIVPAAIVEGLAGVLFAFGTYAVFASASWAWTAALVAHLFAIVGFIVGIYSTRNGTCPFNADYHRVMLVVFVVGVIVLVLPTTRAALGRRTRGA